MRGEDLKTTHRLIYADSKRALKGLRGSSVDLLVTSPPYPMIEMWDAMFATADPRIRGMLRRGEGRAAHEAMHRVLDGVWNSADPAVKQGGTVCVNIGDATRTLGGSFKLYPNHSRVATALLGLGYDALPGIVWRKQSNKPNKFMGSGMLPPGAYVTQEHEHVMVFRKGEKREFHGTPDAENRRRSAFFWEERNSWFSDIWDGLKGARQGMGDGGPRARSAAYPFELAYRLISMFSVRGDTVVDPFGGTGVTTLAAMTAGRNSIGIEINPEFRGLVDSTVSRLLKSANDYNRDRLLKHKRFADGNKDMNYTSEVYGFPVMTRQETALELPRLKSVRRVADDTFEVEHAGEPIRVD